MRTPEGDFSGHVLGQSILSTKADPIEEVIPALGCRVAIVLREMETYIQERCVILVEMEA